MAKIKTDNETINNPQTATDKFQDYIDSEVKSSNIEEGLSEIYQDADGSIVDMKNVGIDHGHSWLYRVFIFLLNLCVLAAIAWAGYYYFYQYRSANDTTSVELEATGPKEIQAGKPFSYVINYKNLDRIDLKNVRINATFPENFIFDSAEPKPSTSTNVWNIDELKMRRSGEIKINGRLIGQVNEHPSFMASMSYMPANFSSEFQKNTSFNSVITSIGMNVDFDAPGSVLVGDQGQLFINIKPEAENYLKNFRVTLGRLENLTLSTTTDPLKQGFYEVDLSTLVGTSTVSTTTSSTTIASEIKIPFSFKERINNKENLSLNFEYSADGQKYYSFLKKDILIEVLTKNINLNLLINASKEDQGVDFGAPLNYTIGYANKGDQSIKNLVVMAVIEGEMVNWQSLRDDSKGLVSGNKITWTSDQIPGLAELAPGVEGVIDFSINIASSTVVSPTKNYQIKSYARFMVGTSSVPNAETDNRSNEITNKINSNLNFTEQIRYFNDDNLAVGSGPQPPRVGEATSYRVYWNLTNDLNEISNLHVETELPVYMSWDDKSLASTGVISYNATTRKVTWDLSKLSVAAAKANSEFSISFTPTTTDANRIAILLNDAKLTATDDSTKMQIIKEVKAKTSKLDDDPVAQSDGMVQK